MFPFFSQSSLIWLLILIVALVVEGVTVSLVSIWFAVGAAAALLVSLLHGSPALEIVLFVLVSAAALVLTKPLVDRLRRSSPTVATNADRNVGRVGVVLTDITAEQPGRIRLDGVDWSARSADGSRLAPGTRCRVMALESTVLVVAPEVPASAQSTV